MRRARQKICMACSSSSTGGKLGAMRMLLSAWSFSFARKPGADTQLRFDELDLSLLDEARL